MTGERVLISGGGVAGPALAHWLHRYGFRPTIVERAPAVRTGGHRVQIEGVGVDALRRTGLLEEARRAAGAPPEEIRFGYGGRREVVIDGASLVTEETGLVIRRGDLCALLYRHTREDVEYLFDDAITALRETDHGVTVSFHHREPREFDLVVGADGIHSHTRALVFGPKERFRRYLGTNIALFDIEDHLGLTDHVIGRVRPGRGVLLAPYPETGRLECTILTRDAEPLVDVAEHKRRLRERFAEDGEPMRSVLAGMDGATTAHVSPSVQIHMDSWTRGRVALVGDAGYCPDPMTGQGSTLALVGACVLAGELARARGDHRVALPAYERAIRGFVDANLALGGTNTAFAAPDTGEWGLRVRFLLYGALIRFASLVGSLPGARRAYTFPLSDHVLV
ncbi:FAD-dependent monooxygenase [Nocardiopsis sp. MG754419]|uniref:FAD-dependent monooxygenase n=1 Tax=Nocardiopsis sp. MG754419 TaxID=2259865 RepID=UPI001BA5CBDE|nr:FAD-dependent monooxygenase [Nocardiopsis sp. MG754419]MBR8745173.1 FAD-binding protein [Nocardiopsis sp. MG754419]